MNIFKEWMYFIRPCLNQLDYYEHIKRMDVFHTLMLKP